ncbi:DUF3221 domain-containing protein [Anaerobacillus sp. MEB173]|uniref:DUF3221 domain-containing protein n=1 Tax=Anaerobacillus sp. MEB173 TaxID=3383345 RepID=UPI003F91EF84
MKKLSLILSLILLSIGLMGCQQSSKEVEFKNDISKSKEEITNKPAITGEIVKIERGRFLVESTTEKLPDGRPDAIWFSTADIDSLKVGQIVSVWTNAINESYPGQASADKIEIKKNELSLDNPLKSYYAGSLYEGSITLDISDFYDKILRRTRY